jgi:hypothetical protein
LGKKSKAALEAENRLLRRSDNAMAVASVFNNLIRFGALCFLAYCTYLTIAALAGKETDASIGISFLGNITVSQSFAYIFGAGGVVYGFRERALRQRTIERLQRRVQELEAAQDPSRTSSKLTPRGETRPQDRE